MTQMFDRTSPATRPMRMQSGTVKPADGAPDAGNGRDATVETPSAPNPTYVGEPPAPNPEGKEISEEGPGHAT